jgi:hypothetical protein
VGVARKIAQDFLRAKIEHYTDFAQLSKEDRNARLQPLRE